MSMNSTIVPEIPPISSLAEFYIGTVRVCPTESGGFWVHLRAGRARFFGSDSETANSIRQGQAIDGVLRARRVFAEGTHEPMVYYRNEEGKIAIPPDPTMIPKGVERLEANSLRAIDRVMNELNLDHLSQFEDTGEFHRGMEEMVGSPRQYLVERLARGSMSNIQRDVTRLMISDLDNEERNRARITSETRHHQGGY